MGAALCGGSLRFERRNPSWHLGPTWAMHVCGRKLGRGASVQRCSGGRRAKLTASPRLGEPWTAATGRAPQGKEERVLVARSRQYKRRIPSYGWGLSRQSSPFPALTAIFPPGPALGRVRPIHMLIRSFGASGSGGPWPPAPPQLWDLQAHQAASVVRLRGYRDRSAWRLGRPRW